MSLLNGAVYDVAREKAERLRESWEEGLTKELRAKVAQKWADEVQAMHPMVSAVRARLAVYFEDALDRLTDDAFGEMAEEFELYDSWGSFQAKAERGEL